MSNCWFTTILSISDCDEDFIYSIACIVQCSFAYLISLRAVVPSASASYMVAKFSFLKKSVVISGLTVLLSTDVMTMVMIGRCFQMGMVADASSMCSSTCHWQELHKPHLNHYDRSWSIKCCMISTPYKGLELQQCSCITASWITSVVNKQTNE